MAAPVAAILSHDKNHNLETVGGRVHEYFMEQIQHNSPGLLNFRILLETSAF